LDYSKTGRNMTNSNNTICTSWWKNMDKYRRKKKLSRKPEQWLPSYSPGRHVLFGQNGPN
jgi:hypothetical protein